MQLLIVIVELFGVSLGFLVMMSSILLFHESVYFIYQFISEATVSYQSQYFCAFAGEQLTKIFCFWAVLHVCLCPLVYTKSLLVKYLINCLYEFNQIFTTAMQYNCSAVGWGWGRVN